MIFKNVENLILKTYIIAGFYFSDNGINPLVCLPGAFNESWNSFFIVNEVSNERCVIILHYVQLLYLRKGVGI